MDSDSDMNMNNSIDENNNNESKYIEEDTEEVELELTCAELRSLILDNESLVKHPTFGPISVPDKLITKIKYILPAITIRTTLETEYIAYHFAVNFFKDSVDLDKIDWVNRKYLIQNFPNDSNRVALLTNWSTNLSARNYKSFQIVYGDTNSIKSTCSMFIGHIMGDPLWRPGDSGLVESGKNDNAFHSSLQDSFSVYFDELDLEKPLCGSKIRKRTSLVTIYFIIISKWLIINIY